MEPIDRNARAGMTYGPGPASHREPQPVAGTIVPSRSLSRRLKAEADLARKKKIAEKEARRDAAIAEKNRVGVPDRIRFGPKRPVDRLKDYRHLVDTVVGSIRLDPLEKGKTFVLIAEAANAIGIPKSNAKGWGAEYVASLMRGNGVTDEQARAMMMVPKIRD